MAGFYVIGHMYQEFTPESDPVLRPGVSIDPLVSLRDEYGGEAHIWKDDGCYVLGLVREERLTSDEDCPTRLVVKPTNHIFPEAFEAMRSLPPLR